MSRALSIAILGAALPLYARPAQAQDVPAASVRSGFTLELGLGAGLTMISPDEGDSSTEFGLSGLSIGLGGFVNSRVALMVRIAGTTFSQDYGEESFTFSNALILAAGQYWFSDEVFVGAGAGVGIVSPAFYEDLEVDGDVGLGLSLRGGYAFVNSRRHSLRAAVEVMPTFYDGNRIIGTGLQLEWQWL